MNNKKIIFLLVFAMFLVSGCKERHNKAISLAYQLTATAPDGALSILDDVKQAKLSKAEMARYALVYTIAQDRSGQDVDNDSLLRTACTYYNKRSDDSLYTKCQYYMGKYYMLNDSTELAVDCFQKSSDAAGNQSDKYTLCLALEKLSRLIRQTNPQRAVEVARHAEKTYSDLPKTSKYNIVYSKLNVSEALLFADSTFLAESKCEDALAVAIETKDSSVLSDVYQDMATIAKQCKNFNLALKYSKASYKACTYFDISKPLNLATAYLDADSLTSCNKLLNSIHTDNAEYK